MDPTAKILSDISASLARVEQFMEDHEKKDDERNAHVLASLARVDADEKERKAAARAKMLALVAGMFTLGGALVGVLLTHALR
jgi:hypothetical protein